MPADAIVLFAPSCLRVKKSSPLARERARARCDRELSRHREHWEHSQPRPPTPRDMNKAERADLPPIHASSGTSLRSTDELPGDFRRRPRKFPMKTFSMLAT